MFEAEVDKQSERAVIFTSDVAIQSEPIDFKKSISSTCREKIPVFAFEICSEPGILLSAETVVALVARKRLVLSATRFRNDMCFVDTFLTSFWERINSLQTCRAEEATNSIGAEQS